MAFVCKVPYSQPVESLLPVRLYVYVVSILDETLTPNPALCDWKNPVLKISFAMS